MALQKITFKLRNKVFKGEFNATHENLALNSKFIKKIKNQVKNA